MNKYFRGILLKKIVRKIAFVVSMSMLTVPLFAMSHIEYDQRNTQTISLSEDSIVLKEKCYIQEELEKDDLALELYGSKTRQITTDSSIQITSSDIDFNTQEGLPQTYEKLSRSTSVELFINDIISMSGEEYFLTNEKAKIRFQLINWGDVAVKNVDLGIFIDGSYIGSVVIDEIPINSSGYVTVGVSGINEGEHIISGWIDCYESISETNEDNNIFSASFLWLETSEHYVPDFKAELEMVEKKEEILASEVVEYEFTVTNEGYAPFDGTVWMKLNAADGSYQTYMIIGYEVSLPVGYSIVGNCEYSFNNGTDGSIGISSIEVDYDNNVVELYESNNTADHHVTVIYPLNYTDYTGRAGVYGGEGIQTNDNLPTWKSGADGYTKVSPSVTVYNSARENFDNDIFVDGCSAWNNISSNLAIQNATFTSATDPLLGSGDIRIACDKLEKDSYYGLTTVANSTDGNFSFNLIILSESLTEEDLTQQKRTMKHEMGHAIGLSHPHLENGDPSTPEIYSAFSSIMWQSYFPASYAVNYITYRDKFAIWALYGK